MRAEQPVHAPPENAAVKSTKYIILTCVFLIRVFRSNDEKFKLPGSRGRGAKAGAASASASVITPPAPQSNALASAPEPKKRGRKVPIFIIGKTH